MTSATDISYIDLRAQWNEIKDEVHPILEEILAGGEYINARVNQEFEKSVCKFLGTRYCISLNSGTDALVCALASVGVRSGAEVVTTANSFIASTAAIAHLGATPIFVDVLPDQGMDPDQLKMALSDKTAAVMPVHLTGKICQMDSISKTCEDAGIPVIEDAAQCIGGMHNGKYGGTFGVAGCFSAHPLKNLNAFGDSGFVVTDDDNVATSIRLMRNHGLADRNTVERFGYVSRMDALQAAILKWKLENQLESVNHRRRKNADFYSQHLTDDLVKPFENKSDLCVYHTYVIQTELRDELQAHLARHGIGSAIHYPVPIHQQPAYIRKFGEYTKLNLGVTEAQASRILSLPIHQNLGEQELSRVVATVNDFFGVR